MKEKSFLIFVLCHLWNARVLLEGADTTSYSKHTLYLEYGLGGENGKKSKD
jgi:hypothetical protein